MFQLCLFAGIHLKNQSKEDRKDTIEEQKLNPMLIQETGNDDYEYREIKTNEKDS